MATSNFWIVVSKMMFEASFYSSVANCVSNPHPRRREGARKLNDKLTSVYRLMDENSTWEREDSSKQQDGT